MRTKVIKKFEALALALIIGFSGLAMDLTQVQAGQQTTGRNGAVINHNSRYDNYTIYEGIDVSSFNGDIDWPTVKASGVDFVFVRVGKRSLSTGEIGQDTKAITNLQGAKAAGIKVGVYFYSQAVNVVEAEQEADFACDMVVQSGVVLDLPVVMDFEFGSSSNNGRMLAAGLDKAGYTELVNAFSARVKQRGYASCVYANKYTLETSLNPSDFTCLVWLAQWTKSSPYEATYTGDYTFWQYSGDNVSYPTASVNGINRTTIDCDYWYCKNPIDTSATGNSDYTPIYRLYLEDTGEHLFTSDKNEANVLCMQHGWTNEGVAWNAPTNGTPVYRLYNSGLKNHLYTSDTNEISVLLASDPEHWSMDNNGQPLFYSGGSKPIYRLYNQELSGMHLYTCDTNEYNTLPSYGWSQENVAFYAK